MSISSVPSEGVFMPVHRPVYHQRPAMPAVIAPRQAQDMRVPATEPHTQVVVPSMSPLVPVSGPFLNYYSGAFYQVPPHVALPWQDPLVTTPPYCHNAVAVHTPIHRTLEHATIAYDTVTEQSLQKELVKDVFFSPAMIAPQETRDLEGASSATSVCGSLQSDCESDASSTGRALVDDELDADALSPHATPYDLLQDDDPLFFIGLDFDQEERTENRMMSTPSVNRLDQAANTMSEHSATAVESGSSKRRRSVDVSDSSSDNCGSKRSKHTITEPALLFDNDDDYFDDASAEESSDDDSQESVTVSRRSASVGQYGFDLADFQSVSVSDDNQSTASWERSEDGESASEDDDFSRSASNANEQQTQEAPDETTPAEKTLPRPTAYPTIYQKLTKANVDWCRYCGTTEGVNWRPGPWGKRTLCNKHGCDYKGYGFACKLPRLDLTGFIHETIENRDRPVLQLFCASCHKQESWVNNVLVRCEGCPKALHQKCAQLTDEFVASDEAWFCNEACRENARRKRIVVELPRKRLPLMCAPKNTPSPTPAEGTRTRSTRDAR